MGSRALRWLPAALWALLIFSLSSQSTLPSPKIVDFDKLMHFGAFAVQGALVALALTRPGERLSQRLAVVAAAIAALYGAADEFHQAFVPGRQSSGFDLVADVLGAAAGAWAWYAFRSR